eukprot:EG_transcript_9267
MAASALLHAPALAGHKRKRISGDLYHTMERCVREARALREGGREAEAIAALREGLEGVDGPAEPFSTADDCQAPQPPLALLASVAHHILGELHHELATQACPQRSLEGEDCDRAWRHLLGAISWWPGSHAALASLAGLYHNRGELEAALACYAAATSPPPLPAGGPAPWVDDWVLVPYCTGLPFNTFLQALLLTILGRHDEARAPLQRLGMRKRLSPHLWSCLNRPPAAERPLAEAPVKFYPNALPEDLWRRLAEFFAPGAPYWKETDYDHRGYFGFWYDVAQPPTNAVECLVQKLLPLTGRQAEVVGTEWWVNTRLAERDMGHQLHYDTEAESISATGQVPHPILSSVSYLAGTTVAGPTVVLDQVVDGPEATRGWIVRPKPGAFMTFPGDRLHGVLPVCPDPSAAGHPATQRVTLMIGFWGCHTPSNAPRYPLGPCGPLPPVTAECTWPSLLACRPEDFPAPADPTLADDWVEEVSPVWDDIPEDPTGAPPLSLPDTVDLLFFGRDHSDWAQHLCSSLWILLLRCRSIRDP